MRRLWITRRKALAACAMKMKVYIEDPEAGDLDIAGVMCRRLGELKNGERKMFSVDYGAARVFAIADKASRNSFYEFCHIPEGRDDVFLSGRNYFQPYSGNPFRFDGKAPEDVRQNRRRLKGTGRWILAVTLVIGAAAGIVLGLTVGRDFGKMVGNAVMEANAQPLVFRTEGMKITLDDRYEPLEIEEYTACYGTGNSAVFVSREPYSLNEDFEQMSLDTYGTLLLENNGLSAITKLQQEDGLTCFEYDFQNPQNQRVLNYYSVLYKGPDAFWMIQFVSNQEESADFRKTFQKFAASVRLEEGP